VSEDYVAELHVQRELIAALDANSKHSRERLLGEMGIIEYDKAGWFDLGTRVEVRPIVHYADSPGIVVSRQLCRRIVARREFDSDKARKIEGLKANLIHKLVSPRKIRHCLALL